MPSDKEEKINLVLALIFLITLFIISIIISVVSGKLYFHDHVHRALGWFVISVIILSQYIVIPLGTWVFFYFYDRYQRRCNYIKI